MSNEAPMPKTSPIRSAVSTEHRLVTDRHGQTDTAPWLVPRMLSKNCDISCRPTPSFSRRGISSTFATNHDFNVRKQATALKHSAIVNLLERRVHLVEFELHRLGFVWTVRRSFLHRSRQPIYTHTRANITTL